MNDLQVFVFQLITVLCDCALNNEKASQQLHDARHSKNRIKKRLHGKHSV